MTHNRGGHAHRNLLWAAVAVCAASAASVVHADDWNETIANARKEGRVVIYATSTAVVRPISELFEKKYGITVDILEARPTELRERARAEFAAGRINGDVQFNGYSSLALQRVDGLLQPHGALPSTSRLVAPFSTDRTVLPVSAGRFPILLNTAMVPPDQEPKSWKDLLDPKWKGRMLGDDPRGAGAALLTYMVLDDTFGRPFIEKLATQNITFGRDFAVSERRVARGEYPIYFPVNVTSLPNLLGLPVKGIVPSEGAPYVMGSAAIHNKAPHPQAARLFLDFLLSDESQRLYADSGSTSVTGQVSEKLPPDIARVMEAKLLGTSDWRRLDEMAKTFTAIFR